MATRNIDLGSSRLIHWSLLPGTVPISAVKFPGPFFLEIPKPISELGEQVVICVSSISFGQFPHQVF